MALKKLFKIKPNSYRLFHSSFKLSSSCKAVTFVYNLYLSEIVYQHHYLSDQWGNYFSNTNNVVKSYLSVAMVNQPKKHRNGFYKRSVVGTL